MTGGRSYTFWKSRLFIYYLNIFSVKIKFSQTFHFLLYVIDWFFSLWNASIDISYCSLREHSDLEYWISFHVRFSWTTLYGSCPISRLIPSRNLFIRILIVSHGSHRVDLSMDFIFVNNWFLSNATKIDLLWFSDISLLLYNSLIISVTLKSVLIAKDVFQMLSKFYRQMLRITWITCFRKRGSFRVNGT